MPPRRHTIPLALSIVATLASVALADDPPPAADGVMDFARDVRPTLARSCASCHGKLAQKGGLRLDQKARAIAGGDTGPVIVPGKSDESPLFRYDAGLEPDHVMPPKKSKGPRPSRDEIAKLRAWIDQGAKWPDSAVVESEGDGPEAHWSFKKPVRPAIPAIRDEKWPRNEIDRYVLARLEKEGIKPSPEADKVTLVRRLSLDLIGLPPTIAEVDAFVNDDRPDAYERLVDRLLASPHYGERWARTWLDKARYADTNGYEKDRERSIWPYRDWVIRALNDDMPFDRFTIKQIAGDMLPDATPDDLVATGFHRNTMRNEEGGIDVEEFRFAAVVDRVATTGATWLGLTVQCAQCHTHKYDPITHREYYQFFAYFNNADEPEESAVPDPEIAAERAAILAEADRRERSLADLFPAEDPEAGWTTLTPIEARSSSGSPLAIGAGGLVTAGGEAPDKDTYTVTFDRPTDLDALRIDAVADPSSPAFGPGRTPHGNFVLTGVSAAIVSEFDATTPVAIASASADFTQATFDPAGLLDDDPRTGWAVDDGSGRCDKTRAATLTFKDMRKADGRSRLVLTLKQEYGGKHTLGRFRVKARAREIRADARPIEVRRREHLAARQSSWESSLKPHRWTIATPTKAESRKLATMNIEPDGAVLVTGDKPNNDTYDVEVPASLPRITAIRLEALTHESLPANGPGRAPLNGLGEFILTEFVANAVGDDPKSTRPIKFATATEDFAAPAHAAAMAIDGVPESGWTVSGQSGKPHSAVFELAEPLEVGDRPIKLAIALHQFGIHNATLGRFRISLTGDARPVRDSGLPAEVESAALPYPAVRSPEQAETLTRHFLAIAPELAAERAKIETLRRSAPKFSTTLMMQERLPRHKRTTNIHKRGEFLSVAEPVEPGLPSLFPTPRSPVRDRLDLAKWMASAENPLSGRVAVNGMWQSFFGRGIVATTEDFGTRGERPSHPELLDWLAVEFAARGWSPKAMHRLIVTSATYRQSSNTTPGQVASDPKNILLARGARFRVDAETVRDIALTASGLMNPKIGGPSVYPPQPDGVTALAYGQAGWPTSGGADRYRRGLYTFTKRAAPFAAFSLMDAPSPEVACVRRERSNTPLQALTLLNDAAFVEAARALAARGVVEAGPTDSERIRFIFRACAARMPSPNEQGVLEGFFKAKRDAFRSDSSGAASLAGGVAKGVERADMAAWVLVARAVLNLDETITRE